VVCWCPNLQFLWQYMGNAEAAGHLLYASITSDSPSVRSSGLLRLRERDCMC
jgi:hypothetical protein